MYRYRFTGLEAEEFSGLAGELVMVQGRASALLEPGDEVELPEPVHHARLEPADEETLHATSEHLAGLLSLPGNTPMEEHPDYEAPEPDVVAVRPDGDEVVELPSGAESAPEGPQGETEPEAPPAPEKATRGRSRASSTSDAGAAGEEV